MTLVEMEQMYRKLIHMLPKKSETPICVHRGFPPPCDGRCDECKTPFSIDFNTGKMYRAGKEVES